MRKQNKDWENKCALKNKREWIKFLAWINYLSPWNFWRYHYDKRRGLKPHIEQRLIELIKKQKEKI